MDKWMDILRTVLPVVLMLLLGMLCRKKKLLTREGIETLKTVAVQIGLPAVLLRTFAGAEYSLATLVAPLVMFLVCVAAWMLGKIAGPRLGMASPFVPFLTTGFEAGMLGYALFALLYGSDQVADFARIDLGQVLFVFTLYKVLLGRAAGVRPSPRAIVKDMASSPIILAILAGVLLGATGLYQALIPSGAAGVLDACADFVSAPVGALILLVIGYDLDLGKIPWRAALGAAGLRLGVMAALGALTLGLFTLLWPAIGWAKPVIFMFLLPPPFVLSVFSEDEGQRSYISAVLSVCTVITLAGFAALAVIG